MSLTVAWKWRLCAPGLTILWGSLTCLGCGLPVSVVPQGPTSRTADAEWAPGLSHYQGWRAVFASSRGAARSQWGTLTTQVIRLAGCKILRDPKGKCTSLL